MADPALLTRGGRRIPPAPLQGAENILDRSIVLYGPSGTGKTTIQRALMYELRGLIEQVIVVSPTARANGAFDGIVSGLFIYSEMRLGDTKLTKRRAIAAEFITKIWQRQELLTKFANAAKDSALVRAVFRKLPAPAQEKARRKIADLAQEVRRATRRLAGDGADPGQLAAVQAKVEAACVQIRRHAIVEHKQELLQPAAALTAAEQMCVMGQKLNHRMLLVLDDCAADLKLIMSEPCFEKLFYQARHVGITVLVSCQDDTDLDPNLRKNVFCTIFTTLETANANFSRSTNSYGRQTLAESADIMPKIFEQAHRKLVFFRSGVNAEHWFHYTAPLVPVFSMQSAAIRELSARLLASSVAVDPSNPFSDRFQRALVRAGYSAQNEARPTSPEGHGAS